MKRLIVALAVLLFASSAWGQAQPMPNNAFPHKAPFDDGWDVRINQRLTAGWWRVGAAFPSFAVGYEHGGSFVGNLYACETDTYAAETCELITALTADITFDRGETARRYYLLEVTTPEAQSTPGTLRILGGAKLGVNKLLPIEQTDGTPYALDEAFGHVYFFDELTAGEIDLLPVKEGLHAYIYNTTSNAITIDPDGTEVIWLSGTALAGGEAMVSTGATGEFVHLVSDGTRWYTLEVAGTWAGGGAPAGGFPYTFPFQFEL